MLIKVYNSMLSVILSGILHMVYTKTPLYKRLYYPLDCGHVLKDGRRLFGANKTWQGLVVMPLINMLVQILLGLASKGLNLNHINYLYDLRVNEIGYNALVGLAFGFMYIIFELPNSFIKRRLDIPEGKTVKGLKGGVFFCIDQVDSMFGVMLVLYYFADISVLQYFLFVALGGLTHIVVNLLLYKLKIRKNL